MLWLPQGTYALIGRPQIRVLRTHVLPSNEGLTLTLAAPEEGHTHILAAQWVLRPR